MSRVNWEERLSLFADEWKRTGISPKEWCEREGFSWGTAKAYISIKAAKALLAGGGDKTEKSERKSRKKTPKKSANSESAKREEKSADKGEIAEKLSASRSVHEDDETPDDFGLSDQLMTFAQFVVDGKTRVEAYRLAGYKGEGNTAYSNASRMLRNARVSRYVHHLRNERQKRYSAELDDVITQLVAIINADPNEISQYRRVNCRYCWGENHKYQWRDLEEQIRAEKKAESENKPPPDLSGGIGFVDNADPNPDCPRCNGEGKGEAFFADTRDLEGDARYLLQGVKLGKFGIEINTADKDAARRELARLLVARGPGGTGKEKGNGKGSEPTVIIKLVNSPDGD
ncbi:terminase small subunit [Citrobacter koseri]